VNINLDDSHAGVKSFVPTPDAKYRILELSMKVAAIIPSRFASTRFQGKPLALIAGKSMIQWVYEAASRAPSIDVVAVATDDNRISDAVADFGGRVVMTDAGHRSGTDRVAEAAHKLGLVSGDIVINVQGDQPLMDPRCLEQVVEPLVAKPALGMSTLAYTIADPKEYLNPKDVKVVMDQKGNALYFSRAPIPFGRDDQNHNSYKHLGIYAYTLTFLDIFNALPVGRLEQIEKLEQLRALEFGYPIRVVVTPYDSPEVDLPEDIERMERLIST
jgi:3-deoxy-manno-octulosonate cytidylyltransferase (CMP-KDO synthetase)